MPSELRKKKDDERKKRSRESLIEAAVRTFVHKGYHNTLISDIVAEAGFGQGTFYRHFKTKREIFEVIFDRFMEDLLSQFTEMSEHPFINQTEYRNASHHAVGKMAALIEEKPDVTALFLREANAIDKAFEAKVTGFYDQFVFVAKYHLDRAIELNLARPCNSEVVAQSLVGIGLRLSDKWCRGELKHISTKDLIAEVVDFAFHGLGLEPPM